MEPLFQLEAMSASCQRHDLPCASTGNPERLQVSDTRGSYTGRQEPCTAPSFIKARCTEGLLGSVRRLCSHMPAA